MAAKRKRCFNGQFHAKLARACHPYLIDFLEFSTVVGIMEI